MSCFQKIRRVAYTEPVQDGELAAELPRPGAAGEGLLQGQAGAEQVRPLPQDAAGNQRSQHEACPGTTILLKNAFRN